MSILKKAFAAFLVGIMLLVSSGCSDVPDGVTESVYENAKTAITYLNYWINDEISKVPFHSKVYVEYESADKYKETEKDQEIIDILFRIQDRTSGFGDYEKFEARQAKAQLENLIGISE